MLNVSSSLRASGHRSATIFSAQSRSSLRFSCGFAGLNKDPLVFVLGFLGCAPAPASLLKVRARAYGRMGKSSVPKQSPRQKVHTNSPRTCSPFYTGSGRRHKRSHLCGGQYESVANALLRPERRWTVPSTIGVSAFGGDSLFGLFTKSIGENLSHFPIGPKLTDKFWCAVQPASMCSLACFHVHDPGAIHAHLS